MTVLEEVHRHFYTYGETKTLLGVSKMTLWRWMQSGKLNAFKLGQESLFEKDAIDELKRNR